MTTRRRTWIVLILIGVLSLAAMGWWAFAPTPALMRADAAPADAVLVRSGSFHDGAPLHTVSGNVSLLEDAAGSLLHFEDYEATSGPDVYFYLTKVRGASTVKAVEEEGIRIGIVAWCERYNVLFGAADLA